MKWPRRRKAKRIVDPCPYRSFMNGIWGLLFILIFFGMEFPKADSIFHIHWSRACKFKVVFLSPKATNQFQLKLLRQRTQTEHFVLTRDWSHCGGSPQVLSGSMEMTCTRNKSSTPLLSENPRCVRRCFNAKFAMRMKWFWVCSQKPLFTKLPKWSICSPFTTSMLNTLKPCFSRAFHQAG